jgi:biopolymer transport protein ExbB
MFSLLANVAPLLAAGTDITTVMGHTIPGWAKGNVFLELFFKGGVVMYPIVAVIIIAVALILERTVWWMIAGVRRSPGKLDKVYAALEQGNVAASVNLARNSGDPLIRTIWHGLNHVHASVEGALQVASGVEIQRAGRFMWAMDTVITLAPLLGLLGTVTGIMTAFNAVNEGGLTPAAVSGGIGEALIATAFGLGIAIGTLIFFNYFNAKLVKLQFELETTCNNVLIMMNALRNKNANLDVVDDARQQPQQFASSN